MIEILQEGTSASGVGATESQNQSDFVIKDEERKRIGEEIRTVIFGIGNRICRDATRHSLHLVRSKIDWESTSFGAVKLQVPIKISSLEREFPFLAGVLLNRFEKSQQMWDVNEDSEITEIGFWNNSHSQYRHLEFKFKNAPTSKYKERFARIIGGYFLGKSFGYGEYEIIRTPSTDLSIQDYTELLEATKEGDRLLDKVISDGKFRATVSSFGSKLSIQ